MNARPVQTDADIPARGTFQCVLPHGLRTDRGTWARRASVRPLTGADELWLCGEGGDAPVAGLVSALIARCLDAIDGVTGPGLEIADRLTVADRVALLMEIRTRALGDRVHLTSTCPNASCGKTVDCGFPVDQLAPQPLPEHLPGFTCSVTSADGARHLIRFRLPTGEDQRAASAHRSDGRAARLHLLARCIEDMDSGGRPDESALAALGAEALDSIESAMEQADPLGSPEIGVVCPECGSAFSVPFKPAPFFMTELVRQSRAFLRDVHALAWHYHWSESEIVGMDARRRRMYLDLVEDEIVRSRN